jgi:quinohemoprotein ethanol dehydrogenase
METKIYRLSTRAPRGFRHLPILSMTLAAIAALVAGAASSADAPAASAHRSSVAHIRAVTAKVDANMIRANAASTKDWPTYGLNYAETRFSNLRQITDANVKNLGLVWSYDLESTRGVEATPLVVDGIMYVTAPWSIVHAIDVRTGKRLWTYDPQVRRDLGYKACCDVVNRGVALYKGKVFVGALDGRLIALDAATGKPRWEVNTVIDPSRSYTITGAPRVFNGNVVIGNSGAEYDVRGYLTAYDAVSGRQKWRWFTVPGDPSKPFENEAMARAAKTWDPSARYWVAGGGGTVWDTMAFDPQLNLMYFGTGNGLPWSRKMRSPRGEDNLYLDSLVALNADTGEYAWHYQETPGDNWDYDSTQPMILADLQIAGQPRKVILHAPKNGFFFVIDRTNGRFISAKKFVDVNWATAYDDNGRPVEIAAARGDKPYDSIPGPNGAHSWHSMSFNPLTGLVYLPVQNIAVNLADDKGWSFNSNMPGEFFSGMGWNLAMFLEPPASKPFGRLIAWDPVAQKETWRLELPSPWNGGTLTSAGNLVFEGTADGRFITVNARTGEVLWESPVGTGIVAAPVTYEVDGVQYVSIAVGWGGTYGLSHRATDQQGPGRVYTFALGGRAPMPNNVKYPMVALVAGVQYDPAQVEPGKLLYVSNCVMCHGVPGVDRGGNIRNLGYVGTAEISNLDSFVFNGPLVSQGMPDFTGKLTADDVAKIKAFIQGTADAIRPK